MSHDLAGRVGLNALAKSLREFYADPLAPWEPWRAANTRPGPLPAEAWRRAMEVQGFEPYVDDSLLADCDVATCASPGRRWVPVGVQGFLQLLANSARSAVDDGVYLGEDGLRFARDIAQIKPRGRVLDIGVGTGVGSLAAALSAEEVLGIDVSQAALASSAAATRIAGRTAVCSYQHADFRNGEAVPSRRWDCIIANLPGVPVPPGASYNPAGDGGPDGLSLTRAFFQALPEWWCPGSGDRDTCLIMRLQSYGDRWRPVILGNLETLAAEHGLLLDVTIDSRMDVATRSALSASYLWRSGVNTRAAAVAISSDHARRLEMEAYYSLSVTAVRAGPGVRLRDSAQPLWLDQNFDAPGPWHDDASAAIANSFWKTTSALPMGFWELGTREDLNEVNDSAFRLYELLLKGATPREGCEKLWSAKCDAYRLGALAAVTNHMVDSMVSIGLLTQVSKLFAGILIIWLNRPSRRPVSR